MNTQLRQKRAGLIAQVRSIQEAANRGVLSSDQLSKIDAIERDVFALESTIAIEERQAKRESAVSLDYQTDSVRAAMLKFLTCGLDSLNAIERRDLQADVAAAGGNIVTPQQFNAGVLVAANNSTFIRKLAQKFTLGTASSLGVPGLSADVADADWSTEVAPVGNDTGMQFSKRSLTPTMLTKQIKVSQKLLTAGSPSADIFVSDRLGYKFGITQEKAFMTGTGTAQPLGLFTASANGIDTSRDIATGNTTTAIGADNLINVQMSVKGQYRRSPSAGWIFHRDAVKNIRLLKDSQNRYLFEASLQAGSPDMLLGSPIFESEYAPNTFTTGLYVGLYGDLSYFWICDQLDLTVQRLNEVYVATNQIGFIGRMSVDGQPVLAEAFARVKLA